MDGILRAGGFATVLRRVLGESQLMEFLTLSFFPNVAALNNYQSSVHAKSEYPRLFK